MKEAFQNFLLLWAEFSIDKLTDPNYWFGWLSAWLAALTFFAFMAVPALWRGGLTPLVAFYSQLARGYYWVAKAIFPDHIGAASHILRRSTSGKLEFDLDYAFAEKLVTELSRNPFRAYNLRQTWVHGCKQDCLIRMNNYGPKKPRRLRTFWLRLHRKNPNPLSRFKAKKQLVTRRYEKLYKPIIASLGNLTNSGALTAMLNIPMERRILIIAKTFAYLPGQESYHRIHIFDAAALTQWPSLETEPVFMLKPEYKDRFTLSEELAAKYKRYPWRFGVLNLFITPEQAAQIRPLFP